MEGQGDLQLHCNRSNLIRTHADRTVVANGKTALFNGKIRQFDSFID